MANRLDLNDLRRPAMQSKTTFDPGEITPVVIESLKNVLEESEAPESGNLTRDTKLLGHNAVLDSLGLVTLLVDLEQRLEEDYDVTITLADERAMSQKSSPFRTVQSLSDYIHMLLQENSANVEP